MPRMELRNLEDGSPFYYNTEGGGALSGFGTTRLYNTGSNLTINFDSSNAHVDNDGSNVKIYNNHNNNMVYNGGTNVEIYSSGSFRELDNVSGQVTIYTSGNGDNWIANNGSNVSINTDAGNDFVWNDGGSYVTINNGAGNDTVNMVSGSNTTINMGSGDDFVENAGSDMEINGGADKDTIAINSGSNILANAGSGNDTIWCTSDCSSVTINCGEGDDYVDVNIGSSNVTIRSGNGSDRISNGGNNVLIELEGDGNSVKTTGSNVTIRSSSGSDYVNVNAGVMNIPYVFEYADGGGHDVVTKDVQIYLLDSALIPYPVIDGDDIVYYIGSGSIRVLDGANAGENFFINEDDPESTENAKYNVPELDMDYLKNKIYEQINTNLDGFLATFDDEPMKSILNDGINSPYLAELSPEIAEQIANSYKDSYETAKNLQNFNSEDDYQTAYLKLKNQWNDAVGNINDLLSNIADVLQIAGTDVNPLLSVIGSRAQLIFSIKDSSDKAKLLSKLKKDFQNKYPNADIDEVIEIEQYKNIFGDTQRLIYANHKIRDIDPELYDEIRLLEIDAEYAKNSVMSNLGAMIFSANSPVIGAIVTRGAAVGVASGVAVGAMIPMWMSAYSSSKKAAEKANYLDGVHLGEQNWYLTWGEQFLGLDYGTVKNWLKGKTSGESPDLAYNYVTTNGVVNAISGDVANDGSLDHATLTGSEENDTLVNSGDYSLIEGYNGDNVVINAGDWATIATGNGNDSIINIGDYSTLVFGAGNDTVENDGEGVTIDAVDGNNYIGNSGNSVIVNSGNGDDYIDNVGNSVMINTGAGDDDIENFGNNVIINAGDGVDYIIDFGNSNSINSGAGDDFIDIKGGYNNIIAYADGYGNDTIYGYNESDIIHLISGTVKSTVASGEDLIVNFETNNLTIKNAANLNVSHIAGNDVVPMLKYGDNYNYTGGSRTIQNYSQNEQINLASDFTGIGLDDNNFYVNSSSGTLTIQNSRDKVISYGTADGNLVAYSFMANSGGDIDGRSLSQFEIIVGADNANNQILAGSGGSSLWGGNGGNDTLTGGEGYDEFFFAIGSGGDVIQNAGDNDLVNLLGVTLDQITVANVSEFSVNVTLADGSYLNVEGNSNVGYKVEGKVYTCNQSTGEWYEK